jgi:hypothetical protein
MIRKAAGRPPARAGATTKDSASRFVPDARGVGNARSPRVWTLCDAEAGRVLGKQHDRIKAADVLAVTAAIAAEDRHR